MWQELPVDCRGPLTVEFFLDGLNLNRILCHHEHASIDRTVSAQVCVGLFMNLVLHVFTVYITIFAYYINSAC